MLRRKGSKKGYHTSFKATSGRGGRLDVNTHVFRMIDSIVNRYVSLFNHIHEKNPLCVPLLPDLAERV